MALVLPHASKYLSWTTIVNKIDWYHRKQSEMDAVPVACVGWESVHIIRFLVESLLLRIFLLRRTLT